MHRLINDFIDLATRIGEWGYVVVFLIVALECQALLGLFMPGESLVLVAGFLAGQGVFELPVLIGVIALAAIVGDSIGYEFGRKLGRDWLRRHGARVGIREEHFTRIDAFIARHGGKSVFASHFLHLFRALMPFIAGANAMPYRRFFPFNAAGCVVWAATFASLGYFFGESWNVVEKWIGRAGAVVGAVVVVILFFLRFWSWLVQHEDELRTRWQTFLDRPRVAALRRQFAAEIEFVEQRLSPGGYLGLHLTIGVVIVTLAGVWFGRIVGDIIKNKPLITIDDRMVAWFNEHATAGVVASAKAVSFVGSPSFLWVMSIGCALWWATRRCWHRVATLVLAVGAGGLIDLAIKHLFQRDRPTVEHPIVELTSYSFPSGHTIGATLFYGLIAFYIAQDTQRWRWRILGPLGACFVVSLVGLSRICLGVHYLTDVLGAMALGLMWLAFCITAVEVDRRFRDHATAVR